MQACDSGCDGETCRDDCGNMRGMLLAVRESGDVGAAWYACERASILEGRHGSDTTCNFGGGSEEVLEVACMWDAPACEDLVEAMDAPTQDWLDSSGW